MEIKNEDGQKEVEKKRIILYELRKSGHWELKQEQRGGKQDYINDSGKSGSGNKRKWKL